MMESSAVIDDFGVTYFDAEKLNIAVGMRISKYLRDEYPMVAENAKLNLWEDKMTRDLVVSLRSFLLESHKLDHTETTTIETPKTPWQFFKQVYMPKWFLKRWPVRVITQHVVTEHHHHYMCPHMQVPPNEPHHAYWMMHGPSSLKDLANYRP